MSEGSSELPFYMRGNHAPVDREVSGDSFDVQGQIPAQLSGLYLRNGPNPIDGDPGHWFLGDGMIHGVRLEGGEAKSYRNRWVRTRPFEGDDTPRVGEDGVADYTIGQANTNIIGHAGKILALVESGFPTEMTPNLDTIGTTDFGGKLAGPFTAHPKICATTGEMLSFGYNFAAPFLVYHQFSPTGELLRSEPIDVPGATMIHDFAITENHVVFMDLPIVFSFENLEQGLPFQWTPEYGARLGVMPRDGGNDDVRWFEIDPCYVFHAMNAHEQNGSIVMDVARYNKLWQAGGNDFEQAQLTRWTIDTSGGGVKEEPLDDLSIEFPRIDPRREGLGYRFGYAISTDGGDGIATQHLVKYDLDNKTSEIHDFGNGRTPSEAVFVPASPDAAEDEGFLLTYVYDANRDSSDFVILDAQNVTSEPLAVVPLPQRVPMGFHGNWIPDPS
ncbi:MAG: carotenoid oxygenase family protein [Myxococcota bacterium]